MRSLRLTLARRFCCTMLVALLAIGGWAYVGVRRTLERQLDQTLWQAAQTQADVVLAHWSLAAHARPPDKQEFLSSINQLVTLRDSSGRIVATNTELARSLELDSAAFARARDGATAFGTGRWLGDPVRAVYTAAPSNAPPGSAVLEVAAALGPLRRASRTVLYLMLGTVVLGAGATMVGAGWLARSATAPVEEIAREAGAITGSRGGERITAHADVLEFTTLIAVINDMLGRLEGVYHWHRRVMRDLGHDLRTPITAMRSGVEVALWSERTATHYREVLASTLEEIDRLTLISDALVQLGRLESGELEANLAPAEAGAIAAQAVSRAQSRVGAHVFTLMRRRAVVPVRADARLLGMVIDQLLDNAMRHTPAGTRVDVAVGMEDARADVTVEDNGPGVADELLPRLFDRFYREDVARGRNGGPGLGLTLAAALIELHQGTIRAERGTAGGLRIRIRLPLLPGDDVLPPCRVEQLEQRL